MVAFMSANFGESKEVDPKRLCIASHVSKFPGIENNRIVVVLPIHKFYK